jgi:hypothetical protein
MQTTGNNNKYGAGAGAGAGAGRTWEASPNTASTVMQDY